MESSDRVMRPGQTSTRRQFLKTAGLGTSALALLGLRLGQEPDRPPNVVILFTDDQGYADVGVFGAKEFETPNIDRMASEGVRFTNFYVSQAVCSASRASLLTGCYAERVGIQGALGPTSRIGISSGEETIARMLKRRGYATGIFGKWHLGHHPEFLPLQHGFDEYFGLPYSNDMWPVQYDGTPATEGRKSAYPPLPLIEGNETIRTIDTLDDQSKLTTWYTERAVSFIERHKNHPFFLYVPFSMPHVPLGVSGRFRGKSRQGMYGDVIMEIDWSVGEILSALTRAGLDQRTLVIFTSDNGPWLNYGNHAGSALPLREGKGTMWEGGARVPCIMRWPNRIPPGGRRENIAATIDLLPTIAAITGASLPPHPIDGVNMLPLLEGNAQANPRDHYAFYYGGELQAVRQGSWKLYFPHSYISYAGNEPGMDGYPGGRTTVQMGMELYNLEQDVSEGNNVAALHPDIVERLSAFAETVRKELGDRLTGTVGTGVRPPGRWNGDQLPPIKHSAVGATVTLTMPPSSRYSGGNGRVLSDGRRGTTDHTDEAWAGFEGVDVDAVLDLGSVRNVKEIACGFLVSQDSWIFHPSTVAIAVSVDGISYEEVFRQAYDGTVRDPIIAVKDRGTILSRAFEARYIRVQAKSVGVCPAWHAGAGGACWLFADEIVVR